MPGRRIPPDIMGYLGPCRQPRGFVEKVIEQCFLAKIEGELADFAPLVAIMQMVTEEFVSKSFADPKVRRAWVRVIESLQADTSLLEHNSFIPCRRCNREFEPVLGEKLLTLFLKWRERRTPQDLVAIHLCPTCGGRIEAKQVRTRDAGQDESAEDDEEWADGLVEEYDF